MSYEGYSQLLCKDGHYWEVDCNCTSGKLEDETCPVCSNPAIWENMVDITNGSFDPYWSMEEKNRIDGYIELEILKEEKCDKCGSILVRIYKIPKKK